MTQFYKICSGHIPEVRLPLAAWRVLSDERILTLAQLQALAHCLEMLPGIGPYSAKAIRLELERVAEQPTLFHAA
jgi:transposase